MDRNANLRGQVIGGKKIKHLFYKPIFGWKIFYEVPTLYNKYTYIMR